MEEKNKNRFDIIDVENLYSQWHPDPIIFLKKIDQECSLDLLAKTETTYLNNSEYKNILNFTNSPECENILSRVEKETDKEKFFEILEERDKLHPRVFDRGYSIEELYDLVENGSYHPLCILELDKRMYMIDGRTRLYCCIFLNLPLKVRILTDNKLYENCRK